MHSVAVYSHSLSYVADVSMDALEAVVIGLRSVTKPDAHNGAYTVHCTSTDYTKIRFDIHVLYRHVHVDVVHIDVLVSRLHVCIDCYMRLQTNPPERTPFVRL